MYCNGMHANATDASAATAATHLVLQGHGVVVSNLKLADADVGGSTATACTLACTPAAEAVAAAARPCQCQHTRSFHVAATAHILPWSICQRECGVAAMPQSMYACAARGPGVSLWHGCHCRCEVPPMNEKSSTQTSPPHTRALTCHPPWPVHPSLPAASWHSPHQQSSLHQQGPRWRQSHRHLLLLLLGCP